MNWYDYMRGYDDGREDYRATRNNKGLLPSLLKFAFAVVILMLRLCFFILKGLTGIVWGIIRIIAGRNR